ncbi:hypothetical protein TCAL_00032 [Tigriopus californicus]|uniref:Dehydrogenase/reductase SDR family member 1 n=1 Tax=Tigriopus californicus TaxID=6832 RepID=A0A553PFF8_TIGCA|nr:dehydrogenase/reductase SDR family member 1-like [Tigriopus californicus]TRY76411.1 hypothetical protein TCAL_00032 [Tigriopus californicus]
MSPNLKGAVCLVTGASRGIGRGIALQLGEAGALVYITGRSQGDLETCGSEIKARGGEAQTVVMDHGNDAEVEQLFERIQREQNGKLDVLVNNAYAGVNTIFTNMGKPFWETATPEVWDSINGVGLRGHYICTVHASRMMVPRKSGLIINVSSGGGLIYLFNVAYGIGKAGCDRMAADCAHELRKSNVAMVSLWPGPVKTEMIQANVLDNPNSPSKSKATFEDGESLEFSGKAVAHLAGDDKIMSKTGRILLSADLAREYGFTDEDGLIHGDMKVIKNHLVHAGWSTLASFTPSFLRVPNWLLYYAGYKF